MSVKKPTELVGSMTGLAASRSLWPSEQHQQTQDEIAKAPETNEHTGADGAADGDELDVAVFQASLHFIALVEAFDGFDVRGFRRVGRACTGFFGIRIP